MAGTCASVPPASCTGACASACGAALTATLGASLPTTGCVPPTDFTGGTACNEQLCAGGGLGCQMSITWNEITYDAVSSRVNAHAYAVLPVSIYSAFFGSCTLELSFHGNVSAGVTLSVTGQTVTATPATPQVDIYNVEASGCGSLGSIADIMLSIYGSFFEEVAATSLADAISDASGVCQW